ncbi:MAG TPA: lysophospholipid acyltransferase family protein [Thermodesulfobacteriota bacterium]|nr:lysophospholipid acyltransferase family protein [Thermodesulfobacteriota bacterium]
MNKMLGIRARLRGRGNGIRSEKSVLILSNHLSYVDIFVISSFFPVSFIASVDEVKSDLLLGKATELSGGFFVERRSRSGLRSEIEAISEILDLGINVALFPEGTTSSGDRVLPFKTPLLSIAEKAGVEILPLCIKYTGIDGEALTEKNRDLIYYYGDMKFFDHFFKLLSVKSVDAELMLLDRIDPRTASSRKEMARSVYDMINSAYMNEGRAETATKNRSSGF